MDWSLIGILLVAVLMLACCWAMMRMMMGPRRQDRKDQEHDGRKEQ